MSQDLKDLEQKLWQSADKLRNNMSPGEYKFVVLGLIFLKYISDSFDERYEKAVAEKYDPEDKDWYSAENVFWVPKEARWKTLQDKAKQSDIGVVVDVRSIPRSRHNPQFNEETLAQSLLCEHIRYEWMKELGGLRHTTKNSMNLGWRNASFRGYADYMATPEFKEGLEELMEIARLRKTAIMCAEAVPWRCHRSLIADALTKEGWLVQDIMSRTNATRHRLTPFLKVRKGQITYPAPQI